MSVNEYRALFFGLRFVCFLLKLESDPNQVFRMSNPNSETTRSIGHTSWYAHTQHINTQQQNTQHLRTTHTHTQLTITYTAQHIHNAEPPVPHTKVPTRHYNLKSGPSKRQAKKTFKHNQTLFLLLHQTE